MGQVAQPVSNLGDGHDLLLGTFPLRNLSTAWVPTLSVVGPIVSAFTLGGELPGAWYGYTGSNGVVDPLDWQPPGPGGSIGEQFRWDDPSHPWPVPENFCDLYACGSVAFVEYEAAAKVLSTDYLGVVTIVALSRAEVQSPFFEYHDVVVLSSIDGGATFTNARIVSTGLSGGGEFERLERVDAATIVTTEEGTERDRDSTAAQVIVWFGGLNEEKWWATKTLVDPSTGRIAVLNEPLELTKFGRDDGFSRITVAAYEDHEGLENIAFFSARRIYYETTVPYGPLDTLEPCPNEERVRIEWHYNRAIGLFDHDPATNPPNWIADNLLIDVDPEWKVCVGDSHQSGAGSALFPNSERGDMAFNRHPWLAKFAYAKTEPEDDRVRVHMVERGLAGLGYHGTPPASGTTRTQILEAPAEADDVHPKIEMAQGIDSTSLASRNNARFALLRRRVYDDKTSAIVARTETWWTEDGGFFNPGGFATVETVDEAALGVPDEVLLQQGTTLGLTHQPICFNDAYGTCSTAEPARLFHAAFPWTRVNVVRGRAFED